MEFPGGLRARNGNRIGEGRLRRVIYGRQGGESFLQMRLVLPRWPARLRAIGEVRRLSRVPSAVLGVPLFS